MLGRSTILLRNLKNAKECIKFASSFSRKHPCFSNFNSFRSYRSSPVRRLYFEEEQELGTLNNDVSEPLFTLPSRYFIDQSVFDKEMDTIFDNTWNYLGHQSELEKVGSYFSARIGKENVFLTKDKQGVIRCFYNVCPHRAHELVSGRGVKPTIVCPNHAWTFKLDGSLIKAKNCQDMVEFDRSKVCLQEVKIENYDGMIFGNLNKSSPPLEESFRAPELLSLIKEKIPRIPDMKCVSRTEKYVEANWKVVVDNFLECYHCETAHKSFSTMAQLDKYVSSQKEFYSHICSPCRPDNTACSFNPDDPSVDAHYIWMWPNFVVYTQPGAYNMSILLFIPVSPTRTLRVAHRFFVDTNLDAQQEKLVSFLNETLLEEDTSLCESMQRGLRSKSYTQGRFVVDKGLSHNSEHSLHHFHSLVKRHVKM